MKRIVIVMVMTILCTLVSKAQDISPAAFNPLGLLCRIDVNTRMDRDEQGFGYYSIPEIRDKCIYLYGPGMPVIVEPGVLRLFLKNLEIELMDATDGVMYINVTLYNWGGDYGYDGTSYYGDYLIELVVTSRFIDPY